MGLFTKKKEGEESRAVATKQQTALAVPPVTDETIDEYMKAFGLAGNLSKEETQAFRHMAVMFNLNPFKREIHCNAYGQGDRRVLTIVTGYEVYISKAEKSGKLEYWNLEEAPPDTPIEKYYATLVVKRRDRSHEQRWTSYFSECAQRKYDGSLNAIWKKQPRFMTKKVTMSQGFRLFFEDVMHGMPYTDAEEEMISGAERNVTPEDQSEPQPVGRPVKETEPKETEPNEPPDTDEPAESNIDYKAAILDLMNHSTEIPNMEKASNIAPALREAIQNGSGLKELYRKICQDYSITPKI